MKELAQKKQYTRLETTQSNTKDKIILCQSNHIWSILFNYGCHILRCWNWSTQRQREAENCERVCKWGHWYTGEINWGNIIWRIEIKAIFYIPEGQEDLIWVTIRGNLESHRRYKGNHSVCYPMKTPPSCHTCEQTASSRPEPFHRPRIRRERMYPYGEFQ
jgi:hypothetical protein